MLKSKMCLLNPAEQILESQVYPDRSSAKSAFKQIKELTRETNKIGFLSPFHCFVVCNHLIEFICVSKPYSTDRLCVKASRKFRKEVKDAEVKEYKSMLL
jgi:hypothetical protein